MPRADLTEMQLEVLSCWAEGSAKRGLLDAGRAREIMSVIAEVRRLRDNESSTRFLASIEEEV